VDSIQTFNGPELLRNKIGVTNNEKILFCAASFYKITKEMLVAFAEILSRVEDSVLLFAPFPSHYGEPKKHLISNWIKVFLERGITANRIIFLNSLGGVNQLRYVSSICYLGLDAFPCSGSTTISDMACGGLPSVTMKGKWLRNNYGAVINHFLNIPDLTVSTIDDYVNLVIQICNDPDMLKNINQVLKNSLLNSNKIFDADGYSNELEKLYLNWNS
jgi:predicted O-linked N-acetylglucosamine transferase (SPINDLY family)